MKKRHDNTMLLQITALIASIAALAVSLLQIQ